MDTGQSKRDGEKKRGKDGNHTERFVCNQKEQKYLIAKAAAPLVAVSLIKKRVYPRGKDKQRQAMQATNQNYNINNAIPVCDLRTKNPP